MEGINNFPQQPHSKEGVENAFEISKDIGVAYTSHINRLIGIEDASDFKNVTENWEELIDTGNRYFKAQSEKFKEIGGTAESILAQLPSISALDWSDRSKFQLLEPSEGVFIIKIDEKVLRKIRKNATAVAVKFREGVSFAMVPIYEDSAVNEMIWKENIPHEVHHLFWKGIMDSGLLERAEVDPDFEQAFAMYQDELIAKMCSNGGLSGYSHLSLLDPESEDNFKKENHEKFERILEIVGSLNSFLHDFSNEMRVRGIKGENLLGLVMKARSFEELKSALDECREFVTTQPITNPDKPVSTGWDYI